MVEKCGEMGQWLENVSFRKERVERRFKVRVSCLGIQDGARMEKGRLKV